MILFPKKKKEEALITGCAAKLRALEHLFDTCFRGKIRLHFGTECDLSISWMANRFFMKADRCSAPSYSITARSVLEYLNI